MKMLKNYLLAGLALLVFNTVQAQKLSPAQTAEGTIGGAHVTINYSAPSARGRKIMGDLVPFGEVWRTGANEATIIQVDKDVKIEGKELKAGKYSLYTIPGEDEWTIIINSQTGQWGIKHGGATTEDPSKDVLRVNVKPEKTESFVETFTITVDKDRVTMMWENTKVSFKVKS